MLIWERSYYILCSLLIRTKQRLDHDSSNMENPLY